MVHTHIYKGKYVSLHECLQTKDKDELLKDDGNLIYWNVAFFISIRSCFLSSQCGSSIIIESYSPFSLVGNLDFIKTDLNEKLPKVDFANVQYY